MEALFPRAPPSAGFSPSRCQPSGQVGSRWARGRLGSQEARPHLRAPGHWSPGWWSWEDWAKMGRGSTQSLQSAESPRSEISRWGIPEDRELRGRCQPTGGAGYCGRWTAGHPTPNIPEGWANQCHEGRGCFATFGLKCDMAPSARRRRSSVVGPPVFLAAVESDWPPWFAQNVHGFSTEKPCPGKRLSPTQMGTVT